MSRCRSPEACGLCHLALSIDDLDTATRYLENPGTGCAALRSDPLTGGLFTCFNDPHGLPLERYQA